MADTGVTIKPGEEMTRIQVACPHQSGLLYVVPAEKSWVCTDGQLTGHALAGFFRELVALKDSRVQELMQSWGVYYRQLPLEREATTTDEAPAPDKPSG